MPINNVAQDTLETFRAFVPVKITLEAAAEGVIDLVDTVSSVIDAARERGDWEVANSYLKLFAALTALTVATDSIENSLGIIGELAPIAGEAANEAAEADGAVTV